MLAALAVSPATYMLALAAVVAGLASRVSSRTLEMGPRAMAAIVMFALSTLAMGLWRFYQGDAQTEIWQKGLFLDAALYLLVLHGIYGSRLRGLDVFLALAVICYVVGSQSADVKVRQIAEAVQICLVATLAWRCFKLTPSNDFLALILMGTLGMAEMASAVLNLDCQFLHGMYGLRPQGAACAAVYGFDVSMGIVTLCAALYAWYLYRWFTPRPS